MRRAWGVVVAGWLFAAGAEASSVGVEVVAEGLRAPIFLVEAPAGEGPLLVGDQIGLVLAMDRATGALAPFLDIRERVVDLLPAFDERGLWSLAFHPDYAANGRLFVTYGAPRRQASPFTGETAYTWRLSEFRAEGDAADPASERVVLEFDWVNRKHNGGGLAFGPDGYLYVGVGDGGGVHGVPDVYVAPPLRETDDATLIQEDPFRLPEEFWHFDAYAQDLGLLQGKILRLDVDAGEPYGIPPTNPFRTGELGRPEIYAWGFRNPFRLSFDAAGTGDLFVSATAEALWETVHLVARPGNYGWAVREGRHCFDRARAFDPPDDCARYDDLGERLRDPIVEYANWSVMRPWSKVEAEPLGTANVGGILYRGATFPNLRGKLVLGDFSREIQTPSGQLFVATPPERWGELWSLAPLLQVDQRLHSLGRDAAGELYLLTTERGIPVGDTGKVWKLVAD